VKHHHRPETQQHIALAVMTKEAEQITALIASLRKSARDIDRQRQQTDIASRRAHDVRRDNLMATITALEDRVSAIQGLIRLDRPYMAHRMH
jgi:acetolactate synthase small subunit